MQSQEHTQRKRACYLPAIKNPSLEVLHEARGKVQHEGVQVEPQMLLVGVGDHHEGAARHVGLVRPRLKRQADVRQRGGVALRQTTEHE